MKIIRFNIFLNLILLTLVSNAQFSYQRLVDHNKIDKAFIKVNKRFESKPNDVSVLYDLSTLYVLLNKKKRKLSLKEKEDNSNKAYFYSQKAIDSFNKLHGADSLYIIKKKINAKTLKRLKYKACKSIFKNVRTRNTITDYKSFIRKHSDYPKLVEIAQIQIYNLVYEQTIAADDIKMYKKFINNYPDSPMVSKIKTRIAELEKKQGEAKQKQKDFLSQTHDYSHLKAVIVLGVHVNINYDYIDEVKKIFTDKNIKVIIFKPEDTHWNDIVKAAKGANFFLYLGHGTFKHTSPTIFGGLVLQDFIFNKKIKSDLKLAPNAVVLMQSVCYSAGTSASDGGFNIGVPMTKIRVTSYAKPYIENGAAVYYANWNTYFFVYFLNAFFKNQSPLSFYNNKIKNNIGAYFMKGDKKITIIYKKEINEAYKYSSKHKICFSSAKRDKKIYYNNATVFKPGFSIVKMIK